MGTILVLLCFISCIITEGFAGNTDISAQSKLKAGIRRCRERFPVSDGEMADIKVRIPDSEDGKCFIACVMDAVKVLKGGKFLKHNAQIIAEIMNKNSEEVIEKTKSIIESCSSQVVNESNVCDFAAALAQCLYDQAKEVGIDDLKIWI